MWVLDYRASPALPSARDAVHARRHRELRLSGRGRDGARGDGRRVRADHGALRRLADDADVARPAASRACARRSRRSSRCTRASALLNEMRAGIYAANVLQRPRRRHADDRADDDPSWAERLYDRALRLYPAGDEHCEQPFCRRMMFMYGEVYDHDQLNDATHEHLHEAFGVANLTTFKQITQRRCARATSSAPTATTSTCRRPTTCGCRSRSCTARTTGSSCPRAASSPTTTSREANGPDLYTRHGHPRLRAHGLLHRQGRRARRLPGDHGRELDRFNSDPTDSAPH